MDERVEELLRQWRENTIWMSSCHAMMERPEFAALVAIGDDAVPALLRGIDGVHGNPHISMILSEITGARPVQPEHAGRMRLVAADWIAWGIREGYLRGA